MKKFILILLVLCLGLGCAVGYLTARDGAKGAGEPVALYDPENVNGDAEGAQSEAGAAPAEPSEPAAESAAEPAAIRTIDYEAIRALHAPDEIAGSVDGRDVSWGDYLYWLRGAGEQAESYLSSLAMYGQSLDWTDKLSAESEETLAGYVVTLAQEYVRQLCTMESVAEENGVTLTAEDEAALAEQLARDIADECGEGASEEDFFAKLEESWLSREMYERLSRFEALYMRSLNTLYGEDGEKVSEEDALAFLRDGDYLCAAHILFRTVDDNFEPLDEETVQKRFAEAEAVSAELRAIEDVEARTARFAELKEQYCEDTGKEAYPDGYLFTAGTMVTEFEDGVKALGEYEVSEPVLSGFGYHVIMRLPLSTEMKVFNTDVDARALYAGEQFNAMMTGRIDESVFTLNDGFALDLTDYLK